MNNDVLRKFEAKKRLTKTTLLKLRKRFDPNFRYGRIICPLCLIYPRDNCQGCPLSKLFVSGCNTLLDAITGESYTVVTWNRRDYQREKISAYIDSLLKRKIYINR